MLFALGFVFMFTIGGLIKNHLALPMTTSIFSPESLPTNNLSAQGEDRFSYFTTICWELLTIILLEFYLISVTMYNLE
jgi:predicted glycosyltransferase